MTRRRADILGDFIEKCVKCGVDISDFTDDEGAAHIRFHRYIDEAPRSIPSQSHLWTTRIDEPKVSSSGWPVEFTSFDNQYPSRNQEER